MKKIRRIGIKKIINDTVVEGDCRFWKRRVLVTEQYAQRIINELEMWEI